MSLDPETHEPEQPTRWVPINYRDFWDVPRVFWFRAVGRIWVFDCLFDDALDEYPELYTIRSVVEPLPSQGDWRPAVAAGVVCGAIPIKAVRFDETLRRSIDWGTVEPALRGMVPPLPRG